MQVIPFNLREPDLIIRYNIDLSILNKLLFASFFFTGCKYQNIYVLIGERNLFHICENKPMCVSF